MPNSLFRRRYLQELLYNNDYIYRCRGARANTPQISDIKITSAVNPRQAWSYEMWFYPYSITEFVHLLTLQVSTSEVGRLFFISSNIIRFQWSALGAWTSGDNRILLNHSNPVVLNTWNHVAVRFQHGQEVALSLNGVVVKHTTSPVWHNDPNISNPQSQMNTISIGGFLDNSSWDLNGAYSHSRIYSTAKTDQYFLNSYNAGRIFYGLDQPDLERYLAFNQIQGDTIKDYAGKKDATTSAPIEDLKKGGFHWINQNSL